MLVVPVPLAATSARVGRSVVVTEGVHQQSRQAAWEPAELGQGGLLSGACRVDCASWLAFQLPPVGGDALFSCLGRDERRGPKTGDLILGWWRGLRTGVIAWGHPAEVLPSEFSWFPGLALPLVKLELLRGIATSTRLILFEGLSICYSKSLEWHLGWGYRCLAPGRSLDAMCLWTLWK